MARRTKREEDVIESGEYLHGSPDASVFVGKACSFTDAIKWAFRKHRTGGVRPKDAPSEEAWSFLETFRECEAAEVLRFMDKLVPKQLPEDFRQQTADDFDGKDLSDVYGEMLKEGV